MAALARLTPVRARLGPSHGQGRPSSAPTAGRPRPPCLPSSAARPTTTAVVAALRRPPVEEASAAESPESPAYPPELLSAYEPEPFGILGRGSFGTVVAARARVRGGSSPTAPPPRVAVKILSKEPGARVEGAPVPEPDRVAARIAREVQALGELQTCPECVELLDVFESDTSVYLVTEMLAGGDLDAALRCSPTRSLPAPALAAVAHDALQVLAAAHAKGITYGDVKPANLLLASVPDAWDDAGESVAARLADFGCARLAGDGPASAGSGPTTGTPLFLAPEALVLGQAGPAVDVWGLGAVLYLALTGRPPFPAPARAPDGGWAPPPNEASTLPAPALSPAALFGSILADDIAFDGHPALDANPGAASFLRALLDRDWDARPTAEAALAHPWLAGVRAARAGPRADAAAARAQRAAARKS